MKKQSGCNVCPHPTCPYGVNTNGVSNCIECEIGVLVLDLSSGPKWKLVCNKYFFNMHESVVIIKVNFSRRCDTIIQIFDDAQKVSVEENVCDCGAQLVTVEYKPEKSKLPDDADKKTGCVFCSDFFAKLVERKKAVNSIRPRQFRGKLAARGRGRAGKKQPKDKMAQLAAYFV